MRASGAAWSLHGSGKRSCHDFRKDDTGIPAEWFCASRRVVPTHCTVLSRSRVTTIHEGSVINIVGMVSRVTYGPADCHSIRKLAFVTWLPEEVAEIHLPRLKWTLHL